jgi:hypothetical protein
VQGTFDGPGRGVVVRERVALSTRLLALDDQSVTIEFCVTDTGIEYYL